MVLALNEGQCRSCQLRKNSRTKQLLNWSGQYCLRDKVYFAYLASFLILQDLMLCCLLQEAFPTNPRLGLDPLDPLGLPLSPTLFSSVTHITLHYRGPDCVSAPAHGLPKDKVCAFCLSAPGSLWRT